MMPGEDGNPPSPKPSGNAPLRPDIELLDPGDSRQLTRTFKLRRGGGLTGDTPVPEAQGRPSLIPLPRPVLPPAAGADPVSPRPPMEMTMTRIIPPPLVITQQYDKDSNPATTLFLDAVAPKRSDPAATAYFSRAALLNRGRQLTRAGNDVKTLESVAPDAVTAISAPPSSASVPPAVLEQKSPPGKATDDSPVELPYLHRIPLRLRMPRVKDKGRAARMVVTIALAVAAAAMFLWPARDLAATAAARPSAAAPVKAPAENKAPVPALAPSAVAAVEAVAVAPPAVAAPGVTPKAAAEAVAEGRYPEALRLYRGLSAAEPSRVAYKDAVRILEDRLGSR